MTNYAKYVFLRSDSKGVWSQRCPVCNMALAAGAWSSEVYAEDACWDRLDLHYARNCPKMKECQGRERA